MDVIVPEKLLHSVLRVKLNGKLMFSLCKKCVEEQLDRPWHERTTLCPHIEKERMMRGHEDPHTTFFFCTPQDAGVVKDARV